MGKVSKIKNAAKITSGLIVGYPKAVSEGITGLLGDKLIDKVKDQSLDLLRKDPDFCDFEENVNNAIKDTKEMLGVNELERGIKRIVSPFKKIFRH